MLSEKQIDPLVELAFNNSPEFLRWFISKTNYKGLNGSCVWSRSNHPWGRLTFNLKDPETDQYREMTRDSETDVLVVLEEDSGKRFAFHIENKLADGHFTLFQPDMYKQRAEAWLRNEKFGNYSEFETILLSPLAFYKRNREEAEKFDRYISYEEASIYIPELADNCQWPI